MPNDLDAAYEAAARARRLATYGHAAEGLKPAPGDRASVDAVWPLAYKEGLAAGRAQAAADIRAAYPPPVPTPRGTFITTFGISEWASKIAEAGAPLPSTVHRGDAVSNELRERLVQVMIDAEEINAVIAAVAEWMRAEAVKAAGLAGGVLSGYLEGLADSVSASAEELR